MVKTQSKKDLIISMLTRKDLVIILLIVGIVSCFLSCFTEPILRYILNIIGAFSLLYFFLYYNVRKWER
ncbi:hypothetical protein NRS6096_22130 (plasmid) [Bacillus subtilis]|nr:hypothetical protein NRS6096_22130 [Bacillus subtilis]